MSNSSIWPINRTLSGDTTPGQSEPGSNGDDGVFHIPQKLQTKWFNIISRKLVWGKVLLLCRDAVGVFYNPNQLGSNVKV